MGFLEYMLNGNLQTSYDSGLFPVSRSGFDELIRKEMEEGSILYNDGSNGKAFIRLKGGLDDYEYPLEAVMDYDNYRAKHDITEAKAAEIRQVLESARTIPVRTEEIQNIISDEAGAYFAGDKSLDEVCKSIENRVQLYLEEHK